jgi:GAF domain-containing protein/anti-sigma regulatory factor (Ser/Thr protein kinase)
MRPADEDDDGESALVDKAFRQASFGMSVFGRDQAYLRLNDMAVEGMGMTEAELRGHAFPWGIPQDVSQTGTLKALRQVIETGRPLQYEAYTRAPAGMRQHSWNLRLWPIRDESGTVCAVGLAAFDSSEQHRARERLAMLDEAAVTIGRSLDLESTARELTRLVVPRFADFASIDLFDLVLHGDDPPGAAAAGKAPLRRVAHAAADPDFQGAAIGPTKGAGHPGFSPPARALRLGHAVLSAGSEDPEFVRWVALSPEWQKRAGHAGAAGGPDGAGARPPRAEAEAGEHGGPTPDDLARELAVTSLLAVPLIARGTTLGVALLVRTRREGFSRDDFTLARELVGRAALNIDNARRYTKERSTALALQASLLPQGPSRQSAVDVASRYRPADSRAGVGGDWFDVIPLSGARVGLVVGDVVGHGIQASATMGRLRTAVQTLADVDLPPDELLAHLDDLVIRLGGDGEQSAGPRRRDRFDPEDSGGLGETPPRPPIGETTGATCLYAIYDPVSRVLTAASAGHPPPVLVLPDGSTRLVDVSVGPVLGVGGLPFESVEIQLPEGSLVALYSDGLVEATDHDPEHGMTLLQEVLGRSHGSLEERCDQLLDAMLPEHPKDDVALVLARTKALHSDHVRVWDLPADSAVVAEARRTATAQLESWGLGDVAFVTELVVSELVTNAIRYGSEPIQLRLIYDRSLICEVSDGNSTSPHLRRARTFDEGGRGLLLVAQLTTDWGTRHTSTGKTIWTEQDPFPATPAFPGLGGLGDAEDAMLAAFPDD